MEDSGLSNSEKSRKRGKSNETLDAGKLLRVITAVKKGYFSVRACRWEWYCREDLRCAQ